MRWRGRYALLGGAAGGGKSRCLQFYPFMQMQVEEERIARGEIETSSGRAIFFRRTMPELREVMDRAQRDFRRVDSSAAWHEQTKTWTFSCGYKYMFGQMEEDKDWLKYQGFELSCCLLDELTTFTEEQFDMLDTRLRSSDPVLSKMLWMRAGTNPLGPGLEWVRARFVEPVTPNTPVTRRIKTPVVKDGVTRYKYVEHKQIFIPAKLEDNPSMDQAAYAATLVTKSNVTKRALLDGDWWIVAGAFLGELWDPSVHVCEPFKIPKNWYRFRSCDYGHAAPASVDWWACDPDGNFICYRNLTVKGHNSEMLAYRIKELEIEAGEWDLSRGCSRLTGPLDSSCWNITGQVGPTIAGTMMDIGVNWFKCDKNRHSAADQVRLRLARRTASPTLKEKDGKPVYCIPGVRWFRTCTAPIRSLPVLPADKNDPEVPDTNANDHNYDSLSYACQHRPISPGQEYTQFDDGTDELSEQRVKRLSGSRLGYRGIG